MIWWIKARRAHLVIPASLAAFALVLAVTHDTTVRLPSLALGSVVETRLALFAPVPLVAGLMLCLESRIPAAEVSAVRSTVLLDTGLINVATLSALGAGAAVGYAFDSTDVIAAGRNTAFLVGLLLLARPVLGEAATLAPVAWLLAVFLAGYRSPNDAYPWTVIPEPLSAWHATVGAALSFVAGVATHLCLSRKTK